MKFCMKSCYCRSEKNQRSSNSVLQFYSGLSTSGLKKKELWVARKWKATPIDVRLINGRYMFLVYFTTSSFAQTWHEKSHGGMYRWSKSHLTPDVQQQKGGACDNFVSFLVCRRSREAVWTIHVLVNKLKYCVSKVQLKCLLLCQVFRHPLLYRWRRIVKSEIICEKLSVWKG